VVGSVFTIAHKIIRFLISSKVALIKADKNEKRRFKGKISGSKTGYKSSGCPQSKKNVGKKVLSLDFELFIGGSILFIKSAANLCLR